MRRYLECLGGGGGGGGGGMSEFVSRAIGGALYIIATTACTARTTILTGKATTVA